MEKQEFLDRLSGCLADLFDNAVVELDEAPYNLMVQQPDGTIFRLQVTESRAHATRANAQQAARVVAFLLRNPSQDSKTAASACGVTAEYVDTLRDELSGGSG